MVSSQHTLQAYLQQTLGLVPDRIFPKIGPADEEFIRERMMRKHGSGLMKRAGMVKLEGEIQRLGREQQDLPVNEEFDLEIPNRALEDERIFAAVRTFYDSLGFKHTPQTGEGISRIPVYEPTTHDPNQYKGPYTFTNANSKSMSVDITRSVNTHDGIEGLFVRTALIKPKEK